MVAAAAANGQADGDGWQAGNATRVADSSRGHADTGGSGDASLLDGSAGMRGTQPAADPELPPRDLMPSHVALVGAASQLPSGLLAAGPATQQRLHQQPAVVLAELLGHAAGHARCLALKHPWCSCFKARSGRLAADNGWQRKMGRCPWATPCLWIPGGRGGPAHGRAVLPKLGRSVPHGVDAASCAAAATSCAAAPCCPAAQLVPPAPLRISLQATRQALPPPSPTRFLARPHCHWPAPSTYRPSPLCPRQVYAFSAENWSRPAAEVDALLALMERTLAAEVADLAARGVRLRFIGELGMLPRSLQHQMRRRAPAGGFGAAAA